MASVCFSRPICWWGRLPDIFIAPRVQVSSFLPRFLASESSRFFVFRFGCCFFRWRASGAQYGVDKKPSRRFFQRLKSIERRQLIAEKNPSFSSDELSRRQWSLRCYRVFFDRYMKTLRMILSAIKNQYTSSMTYSTLLKKLQSVLSTHRWISTRFSNIIFTLLHNRSLFALGKNYTGSSRLFANSKSRLVNGSFISNVYLRIRE